MKVIGNKERKLYIASLVLFAMIPVVAGLLRLLIDGHGIADIWPVDSLWNDEAMYYKQVEGIVKCGIPQGFFGYNESAAESLTFGAWTPLILFPWALWGKIFGWSFISPFIFNFFILSVSFLIYAILTKPGFREVCILFFVMLAFTPISRFAFSYMPEIMIIAHLIVLAGLFVSAGKSPSITKQVLMYLILLFLVIIRPYFAVLFVLPFLSGFKFCGKKRIIITAVTVVTALISLVAYAFFSGRYTAAYYEDMYAGYLDKIFTHGPRLVLKEMLASLSFNWTMVWIYIKNSVVSYSAIGAYFATFLLTDVMLLAVSVWLFISKKVYKAWSFLLLFLAQTAVLLAVLILYNVFDGYRHFICFIVLDIILIICESDAPKIGKYVSGGLGLAAFLFFFLIKADIPEAYSVPYRAPKDPERIAFCENRKAVEQKMRMRKGISWDNTADILMTCPGLDCFYLLPEGFGINMCEKDYLKSNIDSLKSKYLVVTNGDELCNIAATSGWTKIFENDKLVVFSH